MRGSLPAHRSFNVVVAFTVYRVIGRRPSAVYLDSDGSSPTERVTANRLWDLVFEEALAIPGDQIQDRPGGIILVKMNGDAFAVQLSPPSARSAQTAFSHAELALNADRQLAEELLHDGHLTTAPVRRVRVPLTTLPKAKFGEDQPLVCANGTAPREV